MCGQGISGKDLGNDALCHRASQQPRMRRRSSVRAGTLSNSLQHRSLRGCTKTAVTARSSVAFATATRTRERQTGALVGKRAFLLSGTSHFLQALVANPSCSPTATSTALQMGRGRKKAARVSLGPTSSSLTRVVEVVLSLQRLGLLLGGQHLVEAVLAEDEHLPLPTVHLVLPQQLHDLLAHCGLGGDGEWDGRLRQSGGTTDPKPSLSPGGTDTPPPHTTPHHTHTTRTHITTRTHTSPHTHITTHHHTPTLPPELEPEPAPAR